MKDMINKIESLKANEKVANLRISFEQHKTENSQKLAENARNFQKAKEKVNNEIEEERKLFEKKKFTASVSLRKLCKRSKLASSVLAEHTQ